MTGHLAAPEDRRGPINPYFTLSFHHPAGTIDSLPVKLRKVLIAIGILVLLAVLIPIIHHYQLRFVTSRYIARLKASGEPMDLAKVVPLPVPADQNSADTFLKAVTIFRSDFSPLNGNIYPSMTMVAAGKAIVFSQQTNASGDNATNSWDEVAAAVAQNKESFDLLQQIIDKPTFDFHISYDKGSDDFDFNSFHFRELREATFRLEDAALSDLHRGDGASAVKDVRAILALVKAMRTQRLVISELVRSSLAQIAFGATWQVLQSTNVTDEQLAPLQHDWQELQFATAEENTLEMERVMDDITIEKWRRSEASLWRSFYATHPTASASATFDWIGYKSQIFHWRYWWSYPDELLTLKGYQVLVDISRFEKTNSSWLLAEQEMTNNLAKLAIPTNSDSWNMNPDSDMHYAFASTIDSESSYLSRVIKTETVKQLASEALALKRYQLKHGSYPPDAAALVPEFLPELLRDPIDGQPLRYRLKPDGTFLLYSVGENGKDDHGDATPEDPSNSLRWQNGRDWVWPQAATVEEIQNFYKNPPK